MPALPAGPPADRSSDAARPSPAPDDVPAPGPDVVASPAPADTQPGVAGDSTRPRARGARPTPARPTARPTARPRATTRRAGRERTIDGNPDDDDARAEWEAGYAAGYADALRGRRRADRPGDRPDDEPDADDASGTVVVVPPGGDPRYFNNGRYPPPGRANGRCLDRDGDGWCDDPRFGAPVCLDRDDDGRCDDYPAEAAAPYPSRMPSMAAGSAVHRGQGSAEALRWLGTSELVVRVRDAGRTGRPTQILWLDASTNALLQVWSDRDADGVADRIEVYRGGRRVKLIGR